MNLWLAFGGAVAIAVIAYAFGKYWLGLTAFKGHLGSIRWSSYAGILDWWHWGIGLALWLNMDPGMHFTSAGFMFRLGPFTCGWNADDTN